jgi:hypothetical protein
MVDVKASQRKQMRIIANVLAEKWKLRKQGRRACSRSVKTN